MRHRKINIVSALAAAAVLGLALVEFMGFYRSMENKSEWSILQHLEFSHRPSTEDGKVVFASSNGYEAVGIRADSIPAVYRPPKFPRVWLLASPRYGEKLKKIPSDAHYTITSSDLDLILRLLPRISPATENELRQHVMK